MQLQEAISRCPLIAILSDIRPHEAVQIGHVLIEIGFTCLEVPLNSSEDPLASIYHLSHAFKEKVLIGAGTVMNGEAMLEVAKCGGRLIVMPHANTTMIHQAKSNGLYCIPGFSTPTEALMAIDAGADALKFFPANGAPILKEMTTILPKEIPIFIVGGIVPTMMEDYIKAGATGFGLGSAFYQSGDSPNKVAESARIFYDTFRQLT